MQNLKRSKGRKNFRLIAAVALAGSISFGLVSCGSPSQNYVSYKDDGVYLAVPKTWSEISPESLATQEAKSTATGASERAAAVKWQIAFSTDKSVTASDVFSIQNSNNPIVFLRIRSLSAVERNLVSLNSLRDVIVPLSSWIDGALKIPVFTLLEDGELTEKGASGIHSRFIFGPAEGEPQTLDQSVLLSPDRNTLYVLVARCSKTCFEQNQEVLDKIVASFRVQG